MGILPKKPNGFIKIAHVLLVLILVLVLSFIYLVIQVSKQGKLIVKLEDEVILYGGEEGWINELPRTGDTPSIIAEMIVNGAIETVKLADGAVTAVKLADGSVLSAKLVDGSVTSEKIEDGTILTLDISDSAVVTAKIEDGAITGVKLSSGSVSLSKLSSSMCSAGEILKKITATTWGCSVDETGSGGISDVGAGEGLSRGGAEAEPVLSVNVDGDTIEIETDVLQLADGAVTTVKLEDDSVTLAKIVNGAVSSGKLADGAVTEVKLTNGSVATAKLADGAVTTVKIGDTQINTAKLIDLAVTTDKLASNSITTDKISDGTILFEDIAQNACSDNQIMKWNNGASQWECRADDTLVGGETDPTLTNDTAVTVGSGGGDIVLTFDSDGGTDGTVTYLGGSDTFSFNGALTATGYNSVNWDTAYGWGDHSVAGYLTSYTETDTLATVTGRGASTTDQLTFNYNSGSPFTVTNSTVVTNLNADLLDGQHASAFLTSYTETDPIFTASDVFDITNTDQSNWDTAHGWGDHSLAGYLDGVIANQGLRISGSDMGLINICADGQILKWNNGTSQWACQNDSGGTSYTASAGVSLVGSDFRLDTMGCAAYEVLKRNAANDAWECVVDVDTDTTYSALANQGLRLSGTSFGLLNTCSDGQVLKWSNGTSQWACQDDSGVGGETDPTLTNDTAVTIGSGGGDIVLTFDSDGGTDGTVTYLGASDTFSFNGALTATGYNSANWDTAYGWGDHSVAGYLTSYTETDTLADVTGRGSTTTDQLTFNYNSGSPFTVTNSTRVVNLNADFLDGQHASAFLTSYTETDPVFTASDVFDITNTDQSNWDTAHGWGNHSSAGYVDSATANGGLLETGSGLGLLTSCASGQVLKWNGTAWACQADSTGAGYWTDGGTISYLTATADDIAMGGSTSTSTFYLDVSANSLRLGSGSSVNASLNMYALDGDTGAITYTTNDAWAFTGGKVGISTWDPARTLHVAGTEGMRLSASALPGTPGTGDIAIDSGDSNTLKWYDGSSWQSAGGGGGSGDVVGPASATDNAIVRFDSTTGKLIQNSDVLISDTDGITGVASITTDNDGWWGGGTASGRLIFRNEVTDLLETANADFALYGGDLLTDRWTNDDTITLIGNSVAGAGNLTVFSNDIVGIGDHALRDLTDGEDNVAIGAYALSSITTGDDNIGIGDDAGDDITTGSRNIIIGNAINAGGASVDNVLNIGNAITGNLSTGDITIAAGDLLLYGGDLLTDRWTNDDTNTYIGKDVAGAGAMTSFTDNNVGIGYRALFSVRDGEDNVAIGGQTLQSVTDGDDNIAVGDTAGVNITTGMQNTILGNQAAQDITTGSRNIIIGTNVTAGGAAVNDTLNIGDAIFGDLSTGNIGIGTTNLGVNLNVKRGSSDESISSGLTGSWAVRVANTTGTADNNGLLVTTGRGGNSDNWIFAAGWQNTITGVYTDYFRIRSDGNVGIGTTSPSERLDINGTNPRIYLGDATAPGTTTNRLYSVSGSLYWDGTQLGGGGADSDWTISGNDMYSAVSGNVGIGTTAPTVMLEVNCGGGDAFKIFDASGSAGNGLVAGNDGGDGYIELHDAGGQEFVRLDSNGYSWFNSGNVGIGTTLPTFPLVVKRTSGSSGVAIETTATDQHARLLLVNDATSWEIATRGDVSDSLVFRNGGVNRMAITLSGNVGVGTTAPAYKLEIGGGDVNTTAGGYRAAGVCVAGTCASDERLKKNIEFLSPSLDKVLQLNPATFEFIDSKYGSTDTNYGLIAQEVEALFPDWVVTGDDGYKNVRYGLNIQMNLIKALQEEDEKVESLEQEVLTIQETYLTKLDQIISLRQAGIEEGTISISGTTVSYNAFTGSHYAWTDQDIETGMLVSLTGDNKYLHDKSDSEILFGITRTTTANDSRVLGVYLNLLEPDQLACSDNPHLVSAVGNGNLWVADKGSNIEIGDYLISSDIAGHANKNDGFNSTSYIVARAAEPINWDDVIDTVDGVKHKKINVMFENFYINNSAPAVSAVSTTSDYMPLVIGAIGLNFLFLLVVLTANLYRQRQNQAR